jgi:hypothetical protein
MGKRGPQGRRPADSLVELVRRKNDIHLLGQDGLSEDGLSIREMRLGSGQLLLGCSDGPPTCIDLGISYVTFELVL